MNIPMLNKGFFALMVAMHTIGFAEEGGAPTRDQGIWQTFLMLAVAMIFFYFILWRPEQKRRKTLEDTRTNMKKGDRVVAMGIVGTVHRIGQETVILKMVDGSKIEVLKIAITDANSPTSASQVDVEVEEISSN